MAITLNVTLTDSEQARLIAIAEQIAPGATPAQIKTWAEKTAKEGLREMVQRKLSDHHQSLLANEWPAELEPVPPQGAV